jgi:hypothetical protein
VLEVVTVFALVHVAYRSFKHFTELGHREVAAGLNYSAGAAMILASVALVCLPGRRFRAYGLTLEGWRRHLGTGLLWGVLPVLAAGLVVALGRVPIETGKGPSTVVAAVGAAGSLAFHGPVPAAVEANRR